MTDKTFLDHVSDWFKILLRSGVPALLIGMGWVSTFFCSVWLGGSGTRYRHLNIVPLLQYVSWVT